MTSSPKRANPTLPIAEGLFQRRPRTTQHAAKKEAILATAAAMFREKGFEGASFSQLAAGLNVTKATLYHYISSKEDLFIELLRRAHDALSDIVRTAEAAEGQGADKLDNFIRGYAKLMMSDLGQIMLINRAASLQPMSRAELDDRRRRADRLIREIILQGVADGSLAPVDPWVAQQMIFGTLNGLSSNYRLGGRLSAEETIDAMARLLLNSVSAPARRPISRAKVRLARRRSLSGDASHRRAGRD